jgi:MoxR-like ATPase
MRLTPLRSGSELSYSGQRQPKPGEIDSRGRARMPYLPSEELVEAVNLSILLGRPLLLRGEPGCGKSQLARAVAYELDLPFILWSIRSTSIASDGLYIYDAIARLRDAQLAAARPTKFDQDVAATAEPYIQFGPLGLAFKEDRPAVVLIDEIDKADIDFPNDLLDVLEAPQFEILETKQIVSARYDPLIFITSNDEKELPEAFLRRCLFAFVEFPSEERLLAILRAHFPGAPPPHCDLAIKRFLELRRRQEAALGGPKKVTTSELLDWFRALLHEPERVMERLGDSKPFPFQSSLLKRHEDHDFVEKPMGTPI